MDSSGKKVDVAIIGSRVAGSILAAYLAKFNYKILLLDKQAFPSTTLSTHFFRGSGLGKALVDLNVIDEVLALPARKLTQEYYFSSGAATPRIQGPQEPGELGFSLSVVRKNLDFILLNHALQNECITYVPQAKFEDLLWEDDQCIGLTYECNDQKHQVYSRLVVGADGKHSRVAKQCAAEYEKYEKNHRCIFYQYVTEFPGIAGKEIDGTEYYTHGDRMFYVFPSDQNVTCIAMSLPIYRFEDICADLVLYFERELKQEPFLYERFKASKVISKIFAYSGVDNYMRVPAGKGWALVGDAGMHVDPWSGHGMDLAAHQARFLADDIHRCMEAGEEILSPHGYHRKRNLMFTALYDQVVMCSRDLNALLQATA